MTKEELISTITTVLIDKKCQNVLSIDVSAKTDVTEAYIVCSAKNPPQAKAAYEEVCAVMEAKGEYTYGVDGLREGRWIVMDYGKVIVHIFHRDQREFYKLEKVWADAEDIPITTTEQ